MLRRVTVLRPPHALAAAVVAACCVAGSAVAGERAISGHVDQSGLTGVLGPDALAKLVAEGERWFNAKFTRADGAGRPLATQAIIPTRRKTSRAESFQRTAGPDASSCRGCHNDPIAGGAGDFVSNAFVAEGFTNVDFDSTDPQFSNERNTNHLMGAGLIELLAREMTSDLQAILAQTLTAARSTGATVSARLLTKGVDFGVIRAEPDGVVDVSGIDGVDMDLIVRPFGQKGVFTSLRQFTINALNHHHGMQADERFGARWTDLDDFDGDAIDTSQEVTSGDVSALVAWQATRPPPVVHRPAGDPQSAETARGQDVMGAIGCLACHIPALPLRGVRFHDPGPFDKAGTLRMGELDAVAVYDLALLDWLSTLRRNADGDVMVPLFGDLKRHAMTDRDVAGFGNELLSQRFVGRDVFQTAELWGVGSTAPYGHRGDMTTLDEAIRAHGGAARASRDAYAALDERDRDAVIVFLKSLVIEP